MACFLVPTAEAVVSTIITKVVESKEKKAALEHQEVSVGEEDVMKYDGEKFDAVQTNSKIPFSRKLKWLNCMLWGGSALLLFEHIWHGEVVPWFPFLTNAANPQDAIEMVHEMATTGVMMAVLVTAVWGGIVAVTSLIEKRSQAAEPQKGE